MLRFSISLALVLCTFIINAQKGDGTENPLVNNKSYVTFDVFSSLNKYNPRWRIGYVRRILPRWDIGLNFGYGNSNISYTQFIDKKFGEDYELWELRPEIYYVISQSQKSTSYSSLELYYINHKDVFHNARFRPVGGGCYSYDRIDYLRQKYGININIGTFKELGRKLGFNIYTGLGLKVRYNTFSNIVNALPAECPLLDMYDTFEYRAKEGIKVGFNFSIGFKLYLR